MLSIKSTSTPTSAQTASPSLATFNWTPVIQGLVSGVATSFGATVNFPPTVPSPVPSSAPVTSSPSTPSALEARITSLETTLTQYTTQLNALVQAQSNLTKGLEQTNSNVDKLSSNMNTLLATLQAFIATSTPSSNGSGSSSSTPPASAAPSSSSTPSTPASKKSPPTFLNPEIKPLNKAVPLDTYNNQIVTADLEAIITPNGYNHVYMAAWYNGNKSNVFDITQYRNNSNIMLEMFWTNLIENNEGKECYLHNFGGYDSILSLAALLNIPGYKFKPLLNQGQILSIKINDLNGKEVLSIKDSIRILPASLAKLAKDWKVETQKDHFPHYFFLDNIESTLNYDGLIPSYESFEPKRTSLEDYNDMLNEFKNQPWSFLTVSRNYIMGDCKALYQILRKFFETLVSKFPIDPLSVLSAPSTAFKIWRTTQLPKLNKDLLKLYDLSRTLDPKLRQAYCGGIVDVYRPHLIGNGYYYDVNSLYPTSMCRPLPVGMPKLVTITPNSFEEGYFFGYVEATVKAPPIDTHAGYLGLLPFKYQGRLICPGGTFTGFFFSEELRFALNNGYNLLSITQAYEFQRGENTFYELIQQLNNMKIEAQSNNQPTIRNLAKLLMNSMYGRFGMHTDNLRHDILNQEQIAKLSKDFIIKEVISFGKLSLVTYTLSQSNFDVGTQPNTTLRQKLQGLPGNTNVAIAAAVTAYSRMIINQYKLLALEKDLEMVGGKDVHHGRLHDATSIPHPSFSF